MPLDITSANSKLRIVVPAYYPGGFDVDDYSADRMFETAAQTNSEELFSADGFFHAGFVFNPVEQTITIMPTSNAGFLIDDWWSAERALLAKFACNMVLTIPSLGKKWNFVNGAINTWTPAPAGARVLQPRPAVFHFQTINSSPI
ncbi:phage tail fiber protein [Ewingella americana]|uniref:phage tail fiber protein n=1 Tax=Ewingella americana TaxID=41202 RepID=UPI0012AD5499|nr:hypothetical protein [Ewingella americana]MRT01879.1 hypothetical protein [Ewingella americana]